MEGWLRQVYASGGHTPERIEQIIHGGPDFPGPGMLEDIKQMYKLQREWVYISCWHANPHESAAMWRLYTQTQDAVAIRSTYERLARCLSNDALIGLVHYVDFEQMTIALTNAFLPLVFKRKSFEHEREVRAVIAEYPKENGRLVYRPNTKPGRPIHVDLAALIEAVYVAPLARDWFLELVQLMCGNAGLAVDVRRSSLDSKAVW